MVFLISAHSSSAIDLRLAQTIALPDVNGRMTT